MKLTRVQNIGGFQNSHAVEAESIRFRKRKVIHMALKPRQSLRRHITLVDVFFCILEGKGTVEIGDQKQEVERDTLIESPKNSPICWATLEKAIL